MSKVARLGFEVANVGGGSGADVYFPVVTAVTLTSVIVDVSWAPQSLGTAGERIVFCNGAVSRGGAPTFAGGSAAYISTPNDSRFGSVTLYNPAGLSNGFDPNPGSDQFFAVSLRAYVPISGAGGYASRNVAMSPSLAVNAGDYLAFHMNSGSTAVDCEMQIVLVYN